MNGVRYSPADVRARLRSRDQVALVDVREQRQYGEGHALLAVNIPLARIKTDLPRLVPGKAAEVIFCDQQGKQSERAAKAARDMGYSSIAISQGGMNAWRADGFQLFCGTHVLGAALAETLDRETGIQRVSARELWQWQKERKQITVLDSRPWPDFLESHIPGGIDCPLGELAYRVFDVVPDSTSPVVVNCAGRTRSILGVRALLNAGLENPVYSLDQGTYGWWDAGYELARGDGPRADSITAAGSRRALDAARQVAQRTGVVELGADELQNWRAEASAQCFYMLDVRWPEEFENGHAPGAVSAPGGQLVECSEDWIGVRNGRILLLDDDGARARMTGGWLKQLGYPDVAVLGPNAELPATEMGMPPTPAPPDEPYYPAPENELQRMQGKLHYMEWQSTLPDELRSDGLVSFQLLCESGHI